MTKITVLALGCVGLAVASACSSSSSPPASTSMSNNDASTTSSDGGGATGDDASNPLGAPAAGKCPGVACKSGESCCYNPESMTGLCQSASTACGGASIALACSAPSDCDSMEGTGCCLHGKFGSGAVMVSASCVAPSSCVGTGGMTFTILFCDAMHACPSGEDCVPSMYGGEFCQAPDGGASDAGSDSASSDDSGDAGTGSVADGAGE